MKIAGQNQMMNIASKISGGKGALKAKFGAGHNRGRLSSIADRVDLSAKAKKLNNVAGLARFAPGGRAEKIEEFKDIISESRFGDKGVKAAGYAMRKAVAFYKSHAHPL